MVLLSLLVQDKYRGIVRFFKEGEGVIGD